MPFWPVAPTCPAVFFTGVGAFPVTEPTVFCAWPTADPAVFCAVPVAFCAWPAAGAAGLDAAEGVFFAGVTDFAAPAPPGAALPGAVFVGLDVSLVAGESTGFFLEGNGEA